jgi:DNA-binding CsgD family transcriptional regulator
MLEEFGSHAPLPARPAGSRSGDWGTCSLIVPRQSDDDTAGWLHRTVRGERRPPEVRRTPQALAEEGNMEAHVIDIEDEEGMKLLVDGGALAVWELLRRYGGPMAAAAIERVVRFTADEVQRALEVLITHGIVARHPARGRRRMPAYSSLRPALIVEYRGDDADDCHRLETWLPRLEFAMGQAAIRLQVLSDGAAGGAEPAPVRRSVRLSTHLHPQDADELRARVDDLVAFMRLLESKYSGDDALDSFLCNYRVDIEVQPLPSQLPASALVTVRPTRGDWEDVTDEAGDEAGALSPREREVAVGIVNGRSRSDIAARLGITASTVATLTKRLYRKLGVHSKTQLTKRLVGRHETV